MRKEFFTQVNFNGEQIIGIVKIKDYLKAVRSMRNPDYGKWWFVPVRSVKFKGYKHSICNYPIDKIKILTIEKKG